MKIRCWVITGDDIAGAGLPHGACQGSYSGSMPQAANYRPGHWILWQPNHHSNWLTLVCVELPMGELG